MERGGLAGRLDSWHSGMECARIIRRFLFLNSGGGHGETGKRIDESCV